MALYFIISVEEFEKVLDAHKTILVKANRVEEKYSNEQFLGYSFSEFESDQTDWFIFRDSEWNMKNIMFVKRRCGEGKFWVADTSNLLEIDYMDENTNMLKTREAFICDCDCDYGYGKSVLCSYIHGEPIEPFVSPISSPSESTEDVNRITENDSTIDLSKPVV